MTDQPEDRKQQRKEELRKLSWYILAVFILLVFLYPNIFR